MALVLAVLLSDHAAAWTATFYDKTHGGSYTQTDADTPEEARRDAQKGCRAKASDTDCVELGSPVHGSAVVLVFGTKAEVDDAIFYTDAPDPEKAAKNALSNCRREANDCNLGLAAWDSGKKWAALASNPAGTGGIFIKYNADTPDIAEAAAIRGCEKKLSSKGGCKVVSVTSKRTWYAFAYSNNYFGAGWSSESEKNAKQNAMDSCSEGAKGSTCRVTQVFKNDGPEPEPSSLGKLQARIEREAAQRNAAKQKPSPKKLATAPSSNSDSNCRPRGNTLRCSSQCYNGNCTVTYENGCKIRVQVQPKFNPFNNQWDYPAPGC